MKKDDVKTIFKKTAPFVLKHCQSLLSDETLAHDALQEVFLRVIKYHQSYLQAPSKTFWLLRACNQVCLNLLRNQTYRRRFEVKSYDTAHDPKESSIKTAERTLETRGHLLHLFGTFNELDQQIALLYFFYQMTHQDIAKTLGLSTYKVFFRLASIRKQLIKLQALEKVQV